MKNCNLSGRGISNKASKHHPQVTVSDGVVLAVIPAYFRDIKTRTLQNCALKSLKNQLREVWSTTEELDHQVVALVLLAIGVVVALRYAGCLTQAIGWQSH